jgi:hypothetical protein
MDVLTVAEDSSAIDSQFPPRLPWRLGTVALLVLACFLPRAVAAWRWDVLWGDTLHYVHASLALEGGNFQNGFAEFGLNIYPLMLIPLRHLGIDWTVAAKWFSVVVATLTVLPIWGWLRRMFDDRTAVLACLVYALHGKLIAISPLIIRDSTFWLLLALTLYFLWRAVGELHFFRYLAAGIAMTLAIYTRTEGWLLLIPLFGWSLCRWHRCVGRTSQSVSPDRSAAVPAACPTGCTSAPRERSGPPRVRLRLAFGALVCLAVLPTSLAVVNATWLRDQPRWEMLRPKHLEIILDWWKSADAGKPSPSSAGVRSSPPETPRAVTEAQRTAVSESVPPSSPGATPTAKIAYPGDLPPPASIVLPPSAPAERSFPGWLLIFKLLERLAKGFTWVGCVLLLAGICVTWRTFVRPEHLTLLVMNLLLLVVSGIRYRTAGLDLRYFMPVVIVGLPWMALGGQFLVSGALQLARRRGFASPAARYAVAGSAVMAIIVSSLLDGPLSAAATMRRHAAVGRWIRDNTPATPTLAGNIDSDDMSLDAFYAQGRFVGILTLRDCLIVPPPDVLAERQADFVILWNSEDLKRDQLALIEQRITAYYGYRRIAPGQLPAGESELMLFAKR